MSPIFLLLLLADTLSIPVVPGKIARVTLGGRSVPFQVRPAAQPLQRVVFLDSGAGQRGLDEIRQARRQCPECFEGVPVWTNLESSLDSFAALREITRAYGGRGGPVEVYWLDGSSFEWFFCHRPMLSSPDCDPAPAQVLWRQFAAAGLTFYPIHVLGRDTPEPKALAIAKLFGVSVSGRTLVDLLSRPQNTVIEFPVRKEKAGPLANDVRLEVWDAAGKVVFSRPYPRQSAALPQQGASPDQVPVGLNLAQ